MIGASGFRWWDRLNQESRGEFFDSPCKFLPWLWRTQHALALIVAVILVRDGQALISSYHVRICQWKSIQYDHVCLFWAQYVPASRFPEEIDPWSGKVRKWSSEISSIFRQLLCFRIICWWCSLAVSVMGCDLFSNLFSVMCCCFDLKWTGISGLRSCLCSLQFSPMFWLSIMGFFKTSIFVNPMLS